MALGFFTSLLVFVFVALLLAYFGMPAWLWGVVLGGSVLLLGGTWFLTVLIVAVALFFAITPLRRRFFSSMVMKVLDKLGAMPA